MLVVNFSLNFYKKNLSFIPVFKLSTPALNKQKDDVETEMES